MPTAQKLSREFNDRHRVADNLRVQVYETRLPVFHADLYRLGSPEEVVELGFEATAFATEAQLEAALQFGRCAGLVPHVVDLGGR